MKFICHVTTAHPCDDPRIYRRECVSLASLPNYRVLYAASGNLESEIISFHNLGKIPRNRFMRFLRSLLVPWRIFIREKVDVWHIHDLELIPFALVLVLLGKKVIWDSHENYHQQFDLKNSYREYIPKQFQKPIKSFVYWLLNRINKASAGIVCATEDISVKYDSRKTIVVGNETLISQFANCQPSFDNKIALFTGNMSEQQCFQKIVLAVKDVSNLSLKVAGRKNEAELNFAANNLGNRFEYIGWLSSEELVRVCSQVSFGFVTYEDSPVFATNRSNKFFEFSAAGLPILATPTGANLELLKQSKGGIAASDFSVEGIKLAILELVHDRKNWELMSENSRTWANMNGDWKASEQRLFKLYKDILGE